VLSFLCECRSVGRRKYSHSRHEIKYDHIVVIFYFVSTIRVSTPWGSNLQVNEQKERLLYLSSERSRSTDKVGDSEYRHTTCFLFYYPKWHADFQNIPRHSIIKPTEFIA
jgi:hypothetical protein